MTKPTNDEHNAPISDRLSAIRARLDAATPGPWLVRNGWVDLNNLHGDVIPVGHNDFDADLIAHAPADIAYLLDRVEKYRAQLEAEGWIVAD